MEAGGATTIGRTYTKGRRQPYLIRKWPGSNWALPLGPYTITQLVTFVGSVYLLLAYRHVWAKFGGFNLIIGVGLPLLLTYLTRHSRVEGRDPLRAGVALAALLLQPRAGYLGDAPLRAPRPVTTKAARFPVAALPPELAPPPPEPPPPPPQRPPRSPGPPVRRTGRGPVARRRPWLSELVDQAATSRAPTRDGTTSPDGTRERTS